MDPNDKDPPEEEAVDETTEETPPESGVFNEQAEQPQEEKKERPAGYDPVDLEELELPDEVKSVLKDRFDYLYGQVKFNERDKRNLQEHNKKLSEAVEKLYGRVGNIDEGKKTDEISTLKRQIAEAYEEGEYEKAVDLTDQLAEMKAAAKTEPKEEEEKPQTSDLAPDQEKLLTEWLQETGDDGEPRHPYADPNHEDHHLATGLALRLSQDPVAMGKVRSMSDFLDLLDEQMKKQKSKRSTVTPSKQDIRPSQKKKTELSEDEKKIADRMGIPYDAYAKQKAAIEGIA